MDQIDLISPKGFVEFAILLLLGHLRRQALPSDSFFGLRSLFKAADAMILETISPTCLHHFWPLCSQMLPISGGKTLLYSDAAAEVWTDTLDRVLAQDAGSAATRLKWKPSRFGGRAIACPSVMPSAVPASRQKPKLHHSMHDHITDIRVMGEVGREDAEVLRRILAHAIDITGLQLTETAVDATPKPGEFYHLASRDEHAPPGRLRLRAGE